MSQDQLPPLSTPDSEQVEPVVLPAAAEDHIIEQVVASINEATRLSGLSLVESLGQVIFEQVYQGDVNKWRSHGPKESSFRKLAGHSDLQISAPVLSRSVAIYDMCQRLGVGVSSWKHLRVSHLRAAIGLPENEQRRLLKMAEDRGWTAEKLEEHCGKARQKAIENKGGKRRGRPPLPTYVKTLTKLSAIMADGSAFEGLETISELDDVKAQELLRQAREAAATANAWLAQLEAVVGGSGAIPGQATDIHGALQAPLNTGG